MKNAPLSAEVLKQARSELARAAGQKGGYARAKKLTKKALAAVARKGGRARAKKARRGSNGRFS